MPKAVMCHHQYILDVAKALEHYRCLCQPLSVKAVYESIVSIADIRGACRKQKVTHVQIYLYELSDLYARPLWAGLSNAAL